MQVAAGMVIGLAALTIPPNTGVAATLNVPLLPVLQTLILPISGVAVVVVPTTFSEPDSAVAGDGAEGEERLQFAMNSAPTPMSDAAMKRRELVFMRYS